MSASTVENLEFHIKQTGNGGADGIRDLASALKELKAVGGGKGSFIPKNLVNNISALAGSLKAIDSKAISSIRQLGTALKTLDGLKSVSINSKLAQNIADVAAAADLVKKEHVDKLTQFGNALKAIGKGANVGDKLPGQITNVVAAVDKITDEQLDKIRQLTKALARLKGMGDVKIRISGVGSAQTSKIQNAANSGSTGSGPSSSGQSPTGGQSGSTNWLSNMLSLANKLKSPLNDVLSVVGNIVKAVAKVAAGIAKWAFKTAVNAVKRLWSGLKKVASTVVDVGKKIAKHLYDNSVIKKAIDGYQRLHKIISQFGRVAFYRAIRSAIKYVTDALQEGTTNAYWYSKTVGNATRYISEAYDRLSSSQFKMSNQLGAAWATMIATIEPILIRLINLVTKAADALTQFFAILGGKSTYMKAVDYTKVWVDAENDGAKAAEEWKNQLMGFDEINRLEEPSDKSSGSGSSLPDYENMFEETPVNDWFEEIKAAFENGEWAKLGTMLGDKFNEIVNKFDWSGWGQKIGRSIHGAIEASYNFLKQADFKNLGVRIAEFINNAGNEINFETLGRLTTRIKTSLFDVLYGAITRTKWKAVATNISDYFLGALTEFSEWLDTLDPAIIAQAIKDFFGNIKVGEIADKIKEVLKKSWDVVVELVNEIFDDETSERIKNELKNFFGKISEEDVGGSIREKLKSAWSWATETIDEIWPPEARMNFARNIAQKIHEILEAAINFVKENWKTIHNLFAYLLYVIVFGEDKANSMWYNKGDFAGRDLIIGAEYGIQAEAEELDRTLQAYITDPLAQALYDMENKSKTSGENVVTEFDNAVSGDFEEIGKESGAGYVKGLEEDIKNSNSEFDKIGEEIMNKMKADSVLDINSPSEKFKELGKYSGEGYKEGLEEWAEDLSWIDVLFGNVVNEVKNVIGGSDNSAGDNSSFVALGEQTAKGFENGLTKAWSSTSKAISNNLNSTLDIVKQFSSDAERVLVDGLTETKNEMQKAMSEMAKTAQTYFSKIISEMNKLATTSNTTSSRFTSAMNQMKSAAWSASSSIASSMSSIVSSCNRAISALNRVANAQSSSGYGGVTVATVHANGGFPEDGLFFANHNELVGKFSNGKTAVANNDQITNGIAEATYQAFMRAFAENNSGNRSGAREVVLNINGREFARATYDDMKAVDVEHGLSMIVS